MRTISTCLKNVFFSIVLWGILSCSDDEVIVPACLDEQKENLMNIIDEMNPNCLSSAKIQEYFFEDIYIYEVPSLCFIANGLAILYNSECDVLGYKNAALELEINGVRFSEGAELIRTVWAYP